MLGRKQQTIARLVLIAVIIAAVLGGSHRSLAAKRADVAELLVTGTGQDGSILEDRRTQLEICANTAAVAERYLDASLVSDLRQAAQSALASDTLEGYDTARALAEQVLNELEQTDGLTEQDANYVTAFRSQLESYDMVIARNGYNDAARTFNEAVLGVFPANLLGGLTGIRPLEVYE